MFLLDTNVLSELRRADRADARVAAWARSVDHLQFYLSAVTILQIEAGTLLLERRDVQQGLVCEPRLTTTSCRHLRVESLPWIRS